MSESLFVNQLLKWNSIKEDETIERVLWIDPDGTLFYSINIFSKDGLPVLKRTEDILNAIQTGDMVCINHDPFFRVVNESDIKEKDKLIRDKAWEIVSAIISPENEPNVYIREKRGPLVSHIVSSHGVTYATVYKYLRKYWQRGNTKNSLLPDYYNSGGRGKSKRLGSKKVGRPRKNADMIGSGINVDEHTKKIFKIAINKYLDTSKENFVTTAYYLMLKEFYAEDYKFEDGYKKSVLIPPEQIPSITQFRYWYEKEQNLKKSIEARKGKRKYQLQHRAVTGKSDSDVIGPGSKFQIDATIADVYLKSHYNRDWIIGRPVIYFVIDVFSRVIAGVYVGLEGPSWIGAMMALANAFSDKISFCKEYGIDISEEEWPCRHVPQAILGDRGEMESRYADTLVNGLNVRIENTPPYRADWKGIVEQAFNTMDTKVKPFLPGHIDVDFRQRGGKEYRLDAKLNIYEFTQIIIRLVLSHNNKLWMGNYDLDEMMIADDIDPVPLKIWNWGIINRSGKLKTYPSDIVKLNLLPTAKATVTENGIRFKNMYYSCDKAVREMWFEKARNKSSWKENIVYDPRNMDYIYIKSDDFRNFEKCSMLDKRKYGGKTLEEIEYLDAYEKRKKETNSHSILQSKVDLISEIQNIVSEAEAATNYLADKTISKTARLKGIRDNRKNEKNENRKSEAFELGSKEINNNESKVISISDEENINLKYPSHIEYLRKKQKERMEKHNE